MYRMIKVYARVLRSIHAVGETKAIIVSAQTRREAENQVRRSLENQGYRVKHLSSV